MSVQPRTNQQRFQGKEDTASSAGGVHLNT